ncbi:protein IQ-DOMAIN 12-like [Aristolochia californica]|uniref:protein IQ-DOMAIN 12-like n=1 Tax=Aristolochia californica TaxID=171875 RepID=UPI0035E1627F
MAKKKSWLLLFKALFGTEKKSKPDKTEKRRVFLFGRLKSKKSLPAIAASSARIERTLSEVEEEQSKHAMAVAIATTAAAEAAVAAAKAAADVVRLTGTPTWQRQSDLRSREMAAIKIQTAFRAYLARKALCALKALVKVQAMVRGRAVRRQARTTFKSLQSLMKIQSHVNSMRIRMAENNQTFHETGQPHKQVKGVTGITHDTSARKWDGSLLLKERVDALSLNRQEAALKRERAMEYAFSYRERRNAQRPTTSRTLDPECEHNKLNSNWSWLEQWVDAHPWKMEAPKEEQSIRPDQNNHECQIHVSDIPVILDSKYIDKIEETHLRQSPSQLSLRRKSFHLPKKSLIRDDESFSSTPAIPSYMASTESAKAKFRSISTPKQRLGATDSGSDQNSPSRHKISPFLSLNSEVSINRMRRPHGSQQQSPRLRGLAGPVKSHKSWKDLRIDSEIGIDRMLSDDNRQKKVNTD